MKIKLYTNGTTVTPNEDNAREWKYSGESVLSFEVDAEECDILAERWAVVDAEGDVLLNRYRSFYRGSENNRAPMWFREYEDAERLRSALEVGGLSGLSVVKLAEDDA